MVKVACSENMEFHEVDINFMEVSLMTRKELDKQSNCWFVWRYICQEEFVMNSKDEAKTHKDYCELLSHQSIIVYSTSMITDIYLPLL